MITASPGDVQVLLVTQPTMPMLILSFGETALARDEVNVAAARPTPVAMNPRRGTRESGMAASTRGVAVEDSSRRRAPQCLPRQMRRPSYPGRPQAVSNPAEASRVSAEHWDPTPGSGWATRRGVRDGYFWLGSSMQPRVNVPASVSMYPCPAV
jgi:hypothetical protein